MILCGEKEHLEVIWQPKDAQGAQLRNDGESGRAKFEYTPGRLPLHRLAVRPGGYRCTVTR